MQIKKSNSNESVLYEAALILALGHAKDSYCCREQGRKLLCTNLGKNDTAIRGSVAVIWLDGHTYQFSVVVIES